MNLYDKTGLLTNSITYNKFAVATVATFMETIEISTHWPTFVYIVYNQQRCVM